MTSLWRTAEHGPKIFRATVRVQLARGRPLLVCIGLVRIATDSLRYSQHIAEHCLRFSTI